MTRNNSTSRGRKDKPSRTHLSLALPPAEVAALKTIMGWMLQDPAQTDARPCFQTAVRYALQHTLANPPAHVRSTAG